MPKPIIPILFCLILALSIGCSSNTTPPEAIEITVKDKQAQPVPNLRVILGEHAKDLLRNAQDIANIVGTTDAEGKVILEHPVIGKHEITFVGESVSQSNTLHIQSHKKTAYEFVWNPK